MLHHHNRSKTQPVCLNQKAKRLLTLIKSRVALKKTAAAISEHRQAAGTKNNTV